MRFRHAMIASSILLTAVSALAEKPPKRLKLTTASSSIVVDRATADGRVLLLGYEQTMRGETLVLRRLEYQRVADAKGEVTFELGRAMEPSAFWVAVDLATASYGAVTADGRKLREGELPAANIGKEGEQRKEKVLMRFEYAYMVLVRPGVGWWEIAAGDGGPDDADGEMDGKIEFDAVKLTDRAETNQALGEYKEGDLLLVFVPRQMGYLVAGVTK